jgi:hypothetical protein
MVGLLPRLILGLGDPSRVTVHALEALHKKAYALKSGN